MQAVAALEWELGSVANRRRLVFVRLGASAACTTAAMPASLAVTRPIRSVPLAGAALSEHLVQRGENGVNCGARGAVSPFFP